MSTLTTEQEQRVRDIVRDEIQYALRLTGPAPTAVRVSPSASRKAERDSVIIDDYSTGLTMAECAAKHGVHPNTIAAAIHRSGLPRQRNTVGVTRSKVARGELDQEIAATYRAGMTLEKTSIQHGCSVARVVSALDRLGVPHHGRPRKAPGSDARLPRLIQMHEAGETLEAIAAEHRITRERVRQILTRAGINTSDRPMTAEQQAAAAEYAAGDLSLDFYAGKAGVSGHTFRGWVLRCGYVVRPKGNPRSLKAQERAREVARLYDEGLTCKQIAERVGMNHAEEVYRDLGRAGVKPNRHRPLARAA